MQTTMARTERKGMEYFPCVSEIKELSSTKYQIGGYLNFKHNLDYGRDITRDNAFRKTLQEAFARKSKGDPFLFPYLWNHSQDTPPIAGIFDADEDKSGLYTRVQFNPEIELARDVFSSYKMKTLRQQSMGYVATSVNWIKGEDGKGSIRELLAVDLREGSAVIFAMNPLSVVDSVKRSYWPGFSASSADDEAKEGRVLSARTIGVLRRATSGIEKHVGDIQSHLAAQRQNALAGFTLYSASSDEPYDIASALEELTASLETKEGRAISADTHVRIAKATESIMSGVKAIKSLVNEAQRYNESIGLTLHSSDETYEEKRADDPLLDSLRELRMSLTPSTRSVEDRMDEIDARIGVNLAMAALLAASE